MSEIQWKYAKNPNSGKIVSIEDANKLKNQAYVCLDCGGKMAPKKGPKKRHHFSHYAQEDESKCSGEGAKHWLAKINLKRFIESEKNIGTSKITNVKMEKKVDSGLIPDLEVNFTVAINLDVTPDCSANYSESISDKVYLEIVDKGPPSEEKIEKFGKRMIKIDITDRSFESIRSNHFLIDFITLWNEHINQLGSEKIRYYNEGVSNFGVPEFVKKYNCYKCKKEILVYYGYSPDDKYGNWGNQITVHDILRQGVAYTYRYVKKSNKMHWMNVCPYCDTSQSIVAIKNN